MAHRRWSEISFACAAVLLAAACTQGSGDSGGDTAPGGDSLDRGDQASPGDESAGGDSSSGDEGPSGDSVPGEFSIRVPISHQLECADGMGGTTTVTYWDIDHVCLFDNTELQMELYVRARPVGCTGFWGTPVYTVGAAWTKIDGQVAPTMAQYDWGGNHHNDSIGFKVGEQLYVIWHSSIGWGWRACAPPDCSIVCDSGTDFGACDPYAGFTVDGTDGCARDTGDPPPPLPVVCVKVQSDGTVPPLLDPWTQHTGYDQYPLLPCGGDM